MRRSSLRSLALFFAGACAAIAYVVSCSGPPRPSMDMAVAQSAMKTLTNDTDIAQLQSGTISTPGASALITQGPFVLTDVMVSGIIDNQNTVDIGTGTTCPVTVGAPTISFIVYGSTPMHGGRIVVPAGSVACISAVGTDTVNGTVWSGFKPY